MRLSGLEGDFLEAAQTFYVGDEGSHEVAAEQQHRLQTGALAYVGHVHRDLDDVAGLELGLGYADVAVGIFRVAEAEAEGPLHIHHGVVVVGTAHGCAVLAYLVIIGVQGVDMLGIGERQLAGEVLVTGQEGGQGVSAKVGRQHHIHHGGGQGLDVSNQAGTAFVEHQHDGLAGLGQFLHQLLLVGRKIEVVHVTGRLAVGILTHTGDDDIGPSGGGNSLCDAGRILVLPGHGRLVIHHASLVRNVRETGLQGLYDGVVLRDKGVGTSLPGIAPAAVEGTQAIGIGAGDKDLFVFGERQNAVVLQQDLALHGHVIGLMGIGGRCKHGIFMLPGGILKQAQAHFQAQDTADGVVQAGLGNLPFLHQFDDGGAAFGIVGVHDHVDTGVDAQGHGLFLVGGHMVPHIEVVNVGPVGHQQAVPVELFFHPAAEQDGVGVGGDAVDGGRIHHGGEGAGAEAFQERGEVFLPQVVFGDIGRRTVLSGMRNAISHEVLQGHGHVFQVNVVGIGSLQGQRFLTGHFGLQEGVFAEAFPDTRPARVATQVHHRGEHPRHLGGAGFIGHGVAHHTGEIPFEGGADVDFLRIQRAFHQIGGAMDHVHAIDAGNADGFHGLLLDLAHHGSRLLARVGGVMHDVQDGTHLVLADDQVQFQGVDGFVGGIFQGGDVQLDQLAGLFLQGHPCEHTFHFGLHGRVCRNGRGRFGGVAGDNGNNCQGNEVFLHISPVL